MFTTTIDTRSQMILSRTCNRKKYGHDAEQVIRRAAMVAAAPRRCQQSSVTKQFKAAVIKCRLSVRDEQHGVAFSIAGEDLFLLEFMFSSCTAGALPATCFVNNALRDSSSDSRRRQLSRACRNGARAIMSGNLSQLMKTLA